MNTGMDSKELAELKAKADADDPAAMFAYADFVRTSNPAEADKYLVLAAMLGNPQANARLGDKYMDKNDHDSAYHYYRVAAKAGITDCAVKVAVMNLSIDENAAIRDLEELAESGVRSACTALAAYYKALGNRKQYNFWNSFIK